MQSIYQSESVKTVKGFKNLFHPDKLVPKGRYLYGTFNFYLSGGSSEDFKYFIPPGVVKYILSVGTSGPDAYVDMRIDGMYGVLPEYTYDYTGDDAYYQGMVGYTIDAARASDKVCEAVNNKITLINHTAIQYVAGEELYVPTPIEHWVYAYWMGNDTQVCHTLEFVVDKYRYTSWYYNEAVWDDVGDYTQNIAAATTEYVTVSPTSLGFGTINSGDSSGSRYIRFTNISSETIFACINIPEDTPFIDEFTRVAILNGILLQPEGFRDVAFTFRPHSVEEITYTQQGTGTVFNSTRTNIVQDNIIINLTGICPGLKKVITFDKSSIDFGTVASGSSSSTQYLKITNNGELSAGMEYSIAAPFVCDRDKVIYIQAGKYESLALKYSPTDKGNTTHSKLLNFDAMTKEGYELTVPLTGKCTYTGDDKYFKSIYTYDTTTSWSSRVGTAYDKSTHHGEDIEVTVDDYQQKFKIFIPPGTDSQAIYFQFDPEEKSNVIIFSAKIDTIPEAPPTTVTKGVQGYCYRLVDYFYSTKFVSDFEDDGKVRICHEGYNDETLIDKCGWLYVDVYWKNKPAKSFKLIQEYSLNNSNICWIWYTNLLVYHNITPVFDGNNEPLDDSKVYRAVSPYGYVTTVEEDFGDVKVGITQKASLPFASIYTKDVEIQGQTYSDYYYDTFTLKSGSLKQYPCYLYCKPKRSGKLVQFISFKDESGKLFHVKAIANATGGTTNSDYELTPSSYDFGYIPLKQASYTNIIFYNYTSSSITATATVPSGFIGGIDKFTVAGNSDKELTVSFQPTAEQAYSGELTISKYGANSTIYASIQLKGTASTSTTTETITTNKDLANEYASLYVNACMSRDALQTNINKYQSMENVVKAVTPEDTGDSLDVFKTFNLKKLSGEFGTYGVTTAKTALTDMLSGNGSDNNGTINNNISFYKIASEVYSQLGSGTAAGDVTVESDPPGYDSSDEANPDKDDKESTYYLKRHVDYHMLYRKKTSNGRETWVEPEKVTLKIGDLYMKEDIIYNMVEKFPEGVSRQWFPVGLQEYVNLCPIEEDCENNTSNSSTYREYEKRHIKCEEFEKIMCNNVDDQEGGE